MFYRFSEDEASFWQYEATNQLVFLNLHRKCLRFDEDILETRNLGVACCLSGSKNCVEFLLI